MFMGLIALNDTDILNRVHCVMAQKGITDDRLYSLLGIYEQKWTGWKKRGIPADWHYSFAKALDVSIEWLLTGEELGNTWVLTEKEQEAVTIMKKMASFQQDEWLEMGRKMAEMAERFKKALTPDFQNGVD